MITLALGSKQTSIACFYGCLAQTTRLQKIIMQHELILDKT